MSTIEMGFDELYAVGQMDAFLEKARITCQTKLRGKRFAGMENEDVVQEVLLKVFRSMQKFDGEVAKASTFVDHIMDNMIKDCYRKTQTGKNLSIVNAYEIIDSYHNDEDEPDISFGTVQIGKVDVLYEKSEVVTDMMNHLKLSDQEKEVFRLRSSGYEFSEIAELLGKSKARVSQVWKSIRDKYELF